MRGVNKSSDQSEGPAFILLWIFCATYFVHWYDRGVYDVYFVQPTGTNRHPAAKGYTQTSMTQLSFDSSASFPKWSKEKQGKSRAAVVQMNQHLHPKKCRSTLKACRACKCCAAAQWFPVTWQNGDIPVLSVRQDVFSSTCTGVRTSCCHVQWRRHGESCWGGGQKRGSRGRIVSSHTWLLSSAFPTCMSQS